MTAHLIHLFIATSMSMTTGFGKTSPTIRFGEDYWSPHTTSHPFDTNVTLWGPTYPGNIWNGIQHLPYSTNLFYSVFSSTLAEVFHWHVVLYRMTRFLFTEAALFPTNVGDEFLWAHFKQNSVWLSRWSQQFPLWFCISGGGLWVFPFLFVESKNFNQHRGQSFPSPM